MGSISKLMNSRPKTRKKNALKKNVKLCAFASYSFKDKKIVKPYLYILSSYAGIKIVDPDADFIPGQTVFQNILEKGIATSNISFIFITKNFLSSGWCELEAKLAIQEYVKTKGKYRVVPIVLEACKVPNHLKVFNCIHVWMYEMKLKEYQTSPWNYSYILAERLFKAVTAPPLKFQRIRWMGIKIFHRGTNLVSRLRRDAMKDRIRHEVTPAKTILLNYFRLPSLLDHCIMHCKYGNCSFSCSGRNFMKFHDHLKICNYIITTCTNQKCHFVCTRREMAAHLRICNESMTECEFDGCNFIVKRGDLKAHQQTCEYRLKPCFNEENGCKLKFTSRGLQKHLISCDYKIVTCEVCETTYIKIREQHTNRCPMNLIKCPYCHTNIRLVDLIEHLETCQESKSKCTNKGCNKTLGSMQMLLHKSDCAFRKCKCSNNECEFIDTFVKVQDHMTVCEFRPMRCDECGLKVIKREIFRHQAEHSQWCRCELCNMEFCKSSKHMHYKWNCPRRNFASQCGICKDMVPFPKLKDHIQKHDSQVVCVRSSPKEKEINEESRKIELNCEHETPESVSGRGIALDVSNCCSETFVLGMRHLANPSGTQANYSAGRQRFRNLLRTIEDLPLTKTPSRADISRLCFTLLDI